MIFSPVVGAQKYLLIISLLFASVVLGPISWVGAAGGGATYPWNGQSVSDPNVDFWFPSQPNASKYRVAAWELSKTESTGEFGKRLIFEKTISDTTFAHDFSGLGSTTIEWKITPLNTSSAVVNPVDWALTESFRFKIVGQGGNINYISNIQRPAGTPIAFTVTVADGGQQFEASSGASSKRTAIKQCVMNRLKLRLPKEKLIGDIASGGTQKSVRIKRQKAKEFCRNKLRGEKKDSESKSISAAEVGGVFSLECRDPSTHESKPCPSGLSINSSTGRFSWASSASEELIVVVTYTEGLFSDSQAFRLTASSRAAGAGFAKILTKLVGEAQIEPITPAAVKASCDGFVSCETAGNGKLHVVDSQINDKPWVPVNSNNWKLTIKIDQLSGQRNLLVDDIWINWGLAIGSRVPNPSVAGELKIKTATASAADGAIPSDSAFTEIAGLTMVASPLSAYAFCGDIVGEACDGRIHIGRQAGYIQISGTGVLPAIGEIVVSGWDGEEDCDLSSDSRWRALAYENSDTDAIPDYDLPTYATACYGAANTVPSGYIAPEDVEINPSLCPVSSAKRLPGECGCNFPEPSCRLYGDYDCSGHVDGVDLLQWQRDYGDSIPSTLRRYQLPPGSIVSTSGYVVWRNNFGASCPAAGAESTSSKAAAARDIVGVSSSRDILIDNCPTVSNPIQSNNDEDEGALPDQGGDACDNDDDQDGTQDTLDCAPLHAGQYRTTAYKDSDYDGLRDSTTLETIACFGYETPSGYTIVESSIDQCPTNSQKGTPGVCGCNVADTDADSDGMMDCIDQCPADPLKTAPGLCGCGKVENCSGTIIGIPNITFRGGIPGGWENASYLLDGNSATVGTMYPAQPGRTVEFDLGERFAISTVEILPASGIGMAEFFVDLSNDGTLWRSISGTQALSATRQVTIDGANSVGRFLRLRLKRAVSNVVGIADMKIGGIRPFKAEGITATVRANSSSSSGTSPVNMLDGNRSTYWYTSPFPTGSNLTFDLGKNFLLSGLELNTLGSYFEMKKFDLTVSYNGTDFRTIPDGFDLVTQGATSRYVFSGLNSARYVRLTLKESPTFYPVIMEASIDVVPLPEYKNPAISGPVYSSNFPLRNLFDNNPDTFWIGRFTGQPLVLSLSPAQLFSAERLEIDEFPGMGMVDFELVGSDLNSAASLGPIVTIPRSAARRIGNKVVFDLPGIKLRGFALRIKSIADPMYVSLQGIKLYGRKLVDAPALFVSGAGIYPGYVASNLLSESYTPGFFDWGISMFSGRASLEFNFSQPRDFMAVRMKGPVSVPSFDVWARDTDTAPYRKVASQVNSAIAVTSKENTYYEIGGIVAKGIKIEFINNQAPASMMLDHIGFVSR